MTALKLMIVEDEVDFAEFVADVAEGMNFDVKVTDDSSEFLKLYSNNIDIIILDLFMPGIDGIELLRFLQNQNTHASIIFMSGKDKHVLQSAKKIAHEQGLTVLGTLQKPFRADILETLLSSYVLPKNKEDSDSPNLPTVKELQRAVLEDELFLVYQPQINFSNKEVIGVEALIRWEHPTMGNIPAKHFISIAEDNNIISDLTTYATKTAIKQIGAWKALGLDLRMSINFSPKMLDDLDMPEKLEQCATELGADISKIMIEVTETTLMSDVSSYMDILARLRMKGFSLAIDDFGTGYSSLKQLVRSPFSKIKLDQIFVRKIETDQDCLSIIEISILLAHKLGMGVIAEGIENENIWNILQGLGCEEGQGYWMAKPMLAAEFENWISNRRP